MLGISNYASVALLIALVIVSGLGYLQYERANNLQASLATEKANVQTLTSSLNTQRETILELERNLARVQVESEALNAENNRILKDRDEAYARLNGYRDRLKDAALAKPGLVGRAATRAVDRLQSNFEAATSRDEKSTNSTIPSTAPELSVEDKKTRSESTDTERDSSTE